MLETTSDLPKEACVPWYCALMAGIGDALRYKPALYCYRSSEKVRDRIHDCLALNLLVFVGSLLLYHQILMPISTAILATLLDSELLSTSTWLLQSGTSAVYYLLWVFPVFATSLLLNGLWYQELAQAAVRCRIDHRGRRATAPRFQGSPIDLLAAECYRLLLGFVYVGQTALLSGLPVVGRAVAIASVAWLYALYSFEYTWAIVGWPLRRRMHYFSRRYIYFLGYGLPFSLALFFLPWLIRDGMFAALFPFFIINALFATGPKCAQETRYLPKDFQPFRWSYGWTSILLRHWLKPAYQVVAACSRRLCRAYASRSRSAASAL